MFVQGNHDDGPIRAGSQVLVIQDGRLINFAESMKLSKDYALESANVIGQYGPVDIKSTNSVSKMNLSSFLLHGEEVDGSLSLPGWQPDGSCNINLGGYCDFALMDIDRLEVLETAVRFKLSTNDIDVPSRGLIKRDTSWEGFRILPGVHSS